MPFRRNSASSWESRRHDIEILLLRIILRSLRRINLDSIKENNCDDPSLNSHCHIEYPLAGCGFGGVGLAGGQSNAATRYLIWWVMSAMTVFLLLAPRLQTPGIWPQVVSQLPRSGEAATASATYLPLPEVETTPAFVTLPEKPAEKWPLVLFAIWCAVLLYRLAGIGQSYLYLRSVKQAATMSDLRLPETGRNAHLLVSREIESPMAVGFLHAAVIVPEDLIGQITPEELDQILLHEAAHLVRRDDWSNLLARLFGAALALHPVAWWILRQIEHERENACDDWVVARTGAVMPYAESLAHMVELRWQLHASGNAEALASGVFGHGSRIGHRIEMLLQNGRHFSARVSFRRVVVCSFILCCLVAAGLHCAGLDRLGEKSQVTARDDAAGTTTAEAGARRSGSGEDSGSTTEGF